MQSDIDELIRLNENILFQGLINTPKPKKKYEFTIDFTTYPYCGGWIHPMKTM